MADSYLASNEFPGDGSTTLWDISFKGNRPDAGSGVVPYLNPADVKAQLITPATATEAEIVVDVSAVYVGPNQFRVTPAAPVGKIVRLYRATEDEYALVDYQSLQTVGEADLDLSNRQLVFITQEAHDLAVRASEDAGNSSEVAYNAIAVANAATDTANGALSVANTAIATANSALGVASNAETKSDQALAAATSAEAHATDADTAAAAAQTAADAAQVQATAANAASINAVAVANGVDAKATTALSNSVIATNTANTAAATANAIDGKATTALTNANTALTNANAAVATANAIDGKATTALANSVTADSNATSAVNTANSASTAAAAAQTTANTANSAAAAAQSTANSKANKGANSDITSLAGLTTALSLAQGGTGRTDGLAWGNLKGTLSAQADLQAALDAKPTGVAAALATAWVVFNGTTGAILGTSFNVTSVTRTTTGTYRITFTTAMNNINMVVNGVSTVLSSTNQSNQFYPISLTTGYVDVVNRVGDTLLDRSYVAVSIFGGK